MAQIENGRMTHEHDGPIGVFLIGMRFNRLHRPDQWVPVFTAMPGCSPSSTATRRPPPAARPRTSASSVPAR